MAEAGETKVRKREREPITFVCFVVLLLASVVVIGVYVDGEFINKGHDTVQYGDSVKVDYTGSLYGYYDEGSDTVVPVIFDTSVESVGKNADYLFLKSFNKTSYSNLTVNIGTKGMIEGFENALIGHDIGDTVKVCIPAGEGYTVGNFNKSGTSFTFNQNMTVSASEFKSFYGIDDTLSSPYPFDYMGMHLMATPSGSSQVTVNYQVAAGQTYDVYTSEKLGKVTMNISSVADGKVTYTLTITGYKEVKNADGTNVQVEGVNAIEMITLAMFPGVSTNIVGYDGTTVVYNNATDSHAVLSNTALYFVIKIVSRV